MRLILDKHVDCVPSEAMLLPKNNIAGSKVKLTGQILSFNISKYVHLDNFKQLSG